MRSINGPNCSTTSAFLLQISHLNTVKEQLVFIKCRVERYGGISGTIVSDTRCERARLSGACASNRLAARPAPAPGVLV